MISPPCGHRWRMPCASFDSLVPQRFRRGQSSRQGRLEQLETALLDEETASRGELGPVEGGEVGLEDREPLVAVRVQGEARARGLEQGLQAEVAAEEGGLTLGDDELVVVDAGLGQGGQGVLGARRGEVVDALDEDRDRPRHASLLDVGGEPGRERRRGLPADGGLGPDAEVEQLGGPPRRHQVERRGRAEPEQAGRRGGDRRRAPRTGGTGDDEGALRVEAVRLEARGGDADDGSTAELRRQVTERDDLGETLDRRRLTDAGLARRVGEGLDRGGLDGDVGRAAEHRDLHLGP